MNDKILVFIPTYNCEKQIVRVLEKFNDTVEQYIDEVVIIDNRSTDNTVSQAIAASNKVSKKVTILQNHQNYNLGGSIKRAFLYALEHQYDYMITLHGDDQGDIRDFLTVFQKQQHKNNDIVIGARFHRDSILKGYSLVRIIGNRVLNTICGIINRRKVDDLIAGINCFNLKFFKDKFFLTFPNNLTFDAHVLLYAFNKKAKVAYVPITWREEDQISNAKVVRQAVIILKLFFRYVFQGDKVFADNSGYSNRDVDYRSEVIFQRD